MLRVAPVPSTTRRGRLCGSFDAEEDEEGADGKDRFAPLLQAVKPAIANAEIHRENVRIGGCSSDCASTS
jgi:hypothetical protein